jgi:HK97 family phage portal protein
MFGRKKTIEQRDPKGALQTGRMVIGNRKVAPDLNTTNAFVYSQSCWVASRCLDLLANAVAALPIVAGPDRTDRTKINENAVISRLLGPPPFGPNTDTPGYELIYQSVIASHVTGMFGWELELTTTNKVKNIWWLHPQYIEPIVATSGNRYFDRFDYGRVNGAPVSFTPDEIFFFWASNPDNYWQPASALRSIEGDIAVIREMGDFEYSFLANDAVPATIIGMRAFADLDSKEAFQEEMNFKFRGSSNAGKTMIVENPDPSADMGKIFQVERLGTAAKDLLMIDSYRQHCQNVANGLGVPWGLIDSSEKTYANTAEDVRTFYRNTVFPFLRRLEDAINLRLAPKLGKEVMWFDRSSLDEFFQQDNTQIVLANLPEYRASGIITLNEARQQIGLPDVPNGDEFVTTPSQNILTPLPQRQKRDAAPVQTREQFHAERRANLWKGKDKLTRELEDDFQVEVADHLNRQFDGIVKRLDTKRGRIVREQRAIGDIDDLFDSNYWVDETTDSATKWLTTVYDVAGTAEAGRVGFGFDVKAAYVQETINRRAKDLSVNLNDTTRAYLKKELGEGIANGESIEDLATRLNSIFGEARATTIARTEVIGAFNESTWMVGTQLPSDVVAGREWLATSDGRTRADHRSADGNVASIDEPFSVGGESMMFPGDPNGSASQTVNCRCSLALLTPEDYAELTGGRSNSQTESRMLPYREALRLVALKALETA